MGITAVSTIRTGGQNRATPGGYGQADTSAAQSPTLDAGGVVAVVGPAKNGAPGLVHSFSTLDSLKATFSMLDALGVVGIRLAGELLYNASADDAVTGSPESVLAVKTNQDTRSSLIVSSATGPLFTLTSKDYGAHANKVSLGVAAGSAGGVALTIRDGLGGDPETVDNLGTDKVLQLKYVGEATTALLTIDASKFKVAWTLAKAGLNGAASEVKNGWTQATAYVVSANAADTFQRVTLYGTDAADAPKQNTVLLNGTTPVSMGAFKLLTGAKMDGVHEGAVKIASTDQFEVGNTYITFAANCTDDVNGSAVLSVEATDIADVGKQIEIVGYNDVASPSAGTGLVSEIVTLLSVGTAAHTTNKFTSVLRARWLASTPAAPTADIVIYDSTNSSGAPNLSITSSVTAPGFNHTRGLATVSSLPQAGKISLPVLSAGPVTLVLRGKDASNADIVEVLTAALGETTQSFALLDHIELGAIPTTTTLTLSGLMVSADLTDTVDELVSLLTGQPVFTATAFNPERLLSQLDKVSGVNCAVTLGLYSQAWDVIDWISENSGIVSVVAATAPAGLPLVTATPMYLTGGSTVASTVQDYKDAIDALKSKSCDFILVLTQDASVHAYLRDHCEWAYKNSKKRQAIVGITSTSKADSKAATALINSQYVDATDQSVPLYDANGKVRTYGPIAQAALLTGMAASVGIGEPLTWKYLKTAGDVTQPGWSPANDGEEMLRSGLMFCENIEGRGVRIVRSITTYQKKADRILTEHSAVQSLLWSVFDVTSYLAEKLTGKKKSKVSPENVVKLVENRLVEQEKAEGIAGHGKITVTRTSQATYVVYECAPEEPNNFTSVTATVPAN